MRVATALFGLYLAIGLAHAGTPNDILNANRSASGGAAWSRKAALEIDYAYSGQGLKGTTSTLIDLQHPRISNTSDIPPIPTADGFDGAQAWERGRSGTVTIQAGGDVRVLAVNASYRERHLWWLADHAGASLVSEGSRAGGGRYDVLKVAPRGGIPFDAWFDSRTHLLARIVEVQGAQTLTTDYSNYAALDGAMIARKLVVVDASGPDHAKTYTVTKAEFLPAVAASRFAPPRARLSDARFIGGEHETSLPFRLINNHIYADVSVNGGRPLPFLFDTGATNIITPATAQAFKIHPQGAITTLGGGAAVQQSGVARIATLKFGSAVVKDMPANVLQFIPPAVEGIEPAGLIGFEVFARFVTRIDYAKHVLTFVDPKYFDPKDAGTPVPFSFYHMLLEIEGSYDHAHGRFALDTGSRFSLGLTPQFVHASGLRADGAVAAVVGWGIGGPIHARVKRGGVLKLGNLRINAPLTLIFAGQGGALVAGAFPNNVGSGLLKRFIVTFDYARQLVYFKPIAGPIADLDTFDRSGMWINQAPDGFVVIGVTANGPASLAGLQAGDTITKINDTPAAQISLSDLRLRLRNEPAGSVVALTARRGRQLIVLHVTLRDQI